ncbi:eif-2beta [Pristionchus pacificus]|uniref:Eukaryotic translation initiation factor 2 subunit 2 n=1 Tax=Pristionchus pacificus TaxID=54126 RepID=A0A2A6BM56_PRIPA|nr:eif-2beta [Pristionchus pacificus]|eukprot:PDM66985.1 iftb-1 [Pristionchus pacificus]
MQIINNSISALVPLNNFVIQLTEKIIVISTFETNHRASDIGILCTAPSYCPTLICKSFESFRTTYTPEFNMADDDLELNLAKKKKTKKVIKLDDEDESTPVIVDDDASELKLGKKKKKKTAVIEGEEENIVHKDGLGDLGIGRSNLIDACGSWPDYSYEEMLTLVFDIMREKNPELAGEKKKFAMKPPEVGRAGSKKTAFVNFNEICKHMKRNAKHVLQFLMAELGTTGSIDGNNCLIVKGRFQQKHFESVLRKYIKEYVMCHTCKNTDTELTKDTRLFFLQCQSCGSRCSVAAIKSGFTAMVGKRAAARRAAEQTAGK